MISASLNRCKGMEDQVGDFVKQPAAKLELVLLVLCSRLNQESELFGWSRIPNNTGESESDFFVRLRLQMRMPSWIIFTSHSKIGNSCWNGTIYVETFVETEISCCASRFPVILTAKFHSLYVKESEIFERLEILETQSRESKILESRSRIFYFRLRNPGLNTRFWLDGEGWHQSTSAPVAWYMFVLYEVYNYGWVQLTKMHCLNNNF